MTPDQRVGSLVHSSEPSHPHYTMLKLNIEFVEGRLLCLLSQQGTLGAVYASVFDRERLGCRRGHLSAGWRADQQAAFGFVERTADYGLEMIKM
jgi:hypothetical protein